MTRLPALAIEVTFSPYVEQLRAEAAWRKANPGQSYAHHLMSIHGEDYFIQKVAADKARFDALWARCQAEWDAAKKEAQP